MTKRAYLTIDDSPTRHTDAMTDWFLAKNIPAVIFAIGSAYKDMHLACTGMEQNPGPILRAIEKGFVIGNHTYHHRRSSEMAYQEIVEDIEKTEKLIERLYKQAGQSRNHKLIRFPHIDNGCGAWIVDYKAAEEKGYDLKSVFLEGLNISLRPITAQQIEKREKLQNYLIKEGYSADCFSAVTWDWYRDTDITNAVDCLYTYSTSDWMMNPDFEAYRTDWTYQSLDALRQKIDDDPWLHAQDSANIVLAHDHNNLFDVTTSLIDHMQKRGIEFISI